MQYRNGRLLPHTLAITAALAVAACGGGDDAPAPPPAPAPAPVTLEGQVTRMAALENVVVCLDLNGNQQCDAGEPSSAPTGNDGKYSLVAPEADAATARLIALVSTAAIDTASGQPATTQDYVLTRPSGAGSINPLTTLVQTGMDAGMTEEEARANTALQLAIAPAKIEDYQDDPAWDDAQVRDTARTAAVVVSGMLRQGMALEVGSQHAAAPASTTLRQLNYNAPGGYYVRTLDQQAKAADSADVQLVDARSGKSGGVVRTDDSLYGSAYLSPSGWMVCDRSVLVRSALGNPSRTVYCEGETSLGWNRASSVAGESMADLVDRWQAMPSNTINAGISTVALKGALDNAVFPAGAEERVRTNLVLGQTILIDNLSTRAQPQSRNTLEAVIAYYPTSGAAAPTGANTLSLALTTSVLKNLRVSFAPGSATQGTATYYECDLDETQTVVSNCAALPATGGYSIDQVHGKRLLRFTGQPPTPALNYDVAYTEIRWNAADPNSQWVYRTHETKPHLNSRLSTTNRLNGTAWEAMKAKLGL